MKIKFLKIAEQVTNLRYIRACLFIGFILFSAVTEGKDEALVDFNYIQYAPLESKSLSQEEIEGLIHEEIEFSGGIDPSGKTIRTFGYLYYLKNTKNLPIVLWCQGGTGRARKNGIAKILAKKGYLTLTINRPNKEWKWLERFKTEKPTDANFIRFAVTYMRAITYLQSRPEANKELVGIGGNSYGGVFATLVSGLDKRVKTGVSFFSGGNHRLGTNLPQFNALKNLNQIKIFEETGDGAFYHKKRNIPFLWGVAANDNWFYLPAVVQTWREAKSPNKRLAIMPLWEHGFPPNIDNEIFDWFDIYLKKTRAAYNLPGNMKFSSQGDKLIAEWSWTGKNKVKKAELIVSYGLVLPWHGWVHRMHYSIPAKITGNSAQAVIPIAEKNIEMLIYGNIIDENKVLTSSDPLVVKGSDFGVNPINKTLPKQNAFPWGDFEEEAVFIYNCFGMLKRMGKIDIKTYHAGKQALRIDQKNYYRKKNKPLKFKLFNVYGRSHKLSFWLKSDKKAELTVNVRGLPPANWDKAAVKAILATMPRALKGADKGDIPIFTKTIICNQEWQEYKLECPFNGRTVEGYNLEFSFPKDSHATYWIDDIHFMPVWKK